MHGPISVKFLLYLLYLRVSIDIGIQSEVIYEHSNNVGKVVIDKLLEETW